MIKVFTLNKNGKIELTKKQLENLLNEAYYQGKGYTTTWTYTTPTPYYTITNDNITYTTADTGTTIKANDNITYTTTDISNLTSANTGTTIKADDIKYRS